MDTPANRERAWHAWNVAIVLVAVSVAASLAFYRQTLEDAFITFRYSRHLAQGLGLGTWNVGEPPVEGFSSLLWTATLALAERAGLDVIHTSKVIGLLSYAYLCALPAIVGRALSLRRSGPQDTTLARALALTSIALSLDLPVAWYATTGMEAVTFAALVATALFAPYLRAPAWLNAVVAALLVVARPEGIVFSSLVFAFHAFRLRRAGGAAMAPLAGVACGVLVLVSLAAFRLSHFGAWAPNTYFAKANGGWPHVSHGLRYVSTFAAAAAPAALLAAVGLARAMRSEGRDVGFFLAGTTALWAAYVIKVGGDPVWAFPLWRHFVHAAPVWLFLAAWGTTRTFARDRWAAPALAAAMLFLDVSAARSPESPAIRQLSANLRSGALLANEPPNPFLAWLDDLAGPDAVISTSLAGQIPYHVRGAFIDALGLNDRHIAREGTFDPTGPPDSKTDMAYVLARRPDIIEAYFSGMGVRRGRSRADVVQSRQKMARELLDSPEFKRDYLFVANAPYEALDRSIFVRRDFAARRRLGAANLVLVPPESTGLYR